MTLYHRVLVLYREMVDLAIIAASPYLISLKCWIQMHIHIDGFALKPKNCIVINVQKLQKTDQNTCYFNV